MLSPATCLLLRHSACSRDEILEESERDRRRGLYIWFLHSVSTCIYGVKIV